MFFVSLTKSLFVVLCGKFTTMPRTKKDQLQDFGYSWNTMLKHLVQKDLITDNERDMFLDYFFFYSSDKEIKFISEKYKISKADLQKRMEEISALVQQTFRDLYIDAMKFNAFRDKLETLKFQQMHKMIFVDAFFTSKGKRAFCTQL